MAPRRTRVLALLAALPSLASCSSTSRRDAPVTAPPIVHASNDMQDAAPASPSTNNEPEAAVSDGHSCRLELPNEGDECSPGDFDFRGNFLVCSGCAAQCDETGHWRLPGVCVGGACFSGFALFQLGSAIPDAKSVKQLAGRLFKSSGRYHVIGLRASDEASDANLDQLRADAVVNGLIAHGLCRQKFVSLAGGLVTQTYRPREPRPLVTLALISAYADEQLRKAGILK